MFLERTQKLGGGAIFTLIALMPSLQVFHMTRKGIIIQIPYAQRGGDPGLDETLGTVNYFSGVRRRVLIGR